MDYKSRAAVLVHRTGLLHERSEQCLPLLQFLDEGELRLGIRGLLHREHAGEIVPVLPVRCAPWTGED